jgi:hypothetical protein
MKKSMYFEREINLIKDEELRSFIALYLDECVPAYFWTDGASSSGKYHPAFSQGMGGLVRHTKAVVMFAEELLRMSSYQYMKDRWKDYVIAACILHDTFKYGFADEPNKDEYRNHAKNAASQLAESFFDAYEYDISELLTNAIAAHMGQWSTDKDDRPQTPIDRCVHMADYMASRSFIDIPQITEEWERIHNMEMEEDLPF